MKPTQLIASAAVLGPLSGAAVAGPGHTPGEGHERLDRTDHDKPGDPKNAAHVIPVAMGKREFPILGPNSVLAAKSALSAYGQGRYVAFYAVMSPSIRRSCRQRGSPVKSALVALQPRSHPMWSG